VVQARDAVRGAVDVLQRAMAPMTARELADVLIADKAPQATRKRAIDLQAAIRYRFLPTSDLNEMPSVLAFRTIRSGRRFNLAASHPGIWMLSQSSESLVLPQKIDGAILNFLPPYLQDLKPVLDPSGIAPTK